MGHDQSTPDLKSKIATEQTDTVFLDSYQMGPRFQSQTRETGAVTVVIDDQAIDQYDCDHLINYALTASEEDYLLFCSIHQPYTWA